MKRTRGVALSSTSERPRRKLRKTSAPQHTKVPVTSCPAPENDLAPIPEILQPIRQNPAPESEQSSSEGMAAEQGTKLPIPCIFAGEDEADCTDRPSQMILTDDGTKSSPAILLNYGLSREIQEFIKAECQLVTQRLRSDELTKVLRSFRKYGRDEIEELLEKCDALDGVPGKEMKLARYNAKSRSIEARLAQADDLERDARRNLLQAERFSKKRALEVAILLGDVFYGCRLLPPEEDPSLNPAIVQTFAVPDHSSVTESSSSSDLGGVAVSGAQSAIPETVYVDPAADDVKKAYRRAFTELFEAREDFEYKDYQRDQEVLRLRHQIADGQHPMETAEDFDLRHLLHSRKLTRRLIEAEANFAQAKAKAVEAGVSITTSHQSSGFVDRANDGRCSGEAVTFANIDRPQILKWLDEIPESSAEWTKLPAYRPQEADQWELRSVGLSDSASLVAEGSERMRIDQWAQSCKELRSRPRLPRS